MKPPIMVVMGVSGCGKSTVGLLLAGALDAPYVEGDDLHSPENVERMRAGIALDDAQRRDWLQALAARLAQVDDWHAAAAGLGRRRERVRAGGEHREAEDLIRTA